MYIVFISSIRHENLRFNFAIQILYVCTILKKKQQMREKKIKVQEIIFFKKSLGVTGIQFSKIIMVLSQNNGRHKIVK